MNRRIFPALVAAATMIATGCAQNPSDNPTGYGPTSSTPSPTNSDEAKAIENFDFTSAEWYDARSRQMLDASASSSRDSWWQVDTGTKGNPVQYGDLNGDGYEDAVAWMTAGEGNGYWHYAYVWTWDPEQGTAVQSPYPVTDDASCGNATKQLDIDAESGEITVARLIRYGEPCSELPTHEVTNTIKLENGVPIRTAPVRAGVDRCMDPASDSRKTTDVLSKPLKLAPDADVPELDLDRVDRVVLGGGRDQTVNDYHQVLFHAEGDSVTWYCAFTDEVAIAGG